MSKFVWAAALALGCAAMAGGGASAAPFGPGLALQQDAAPAIVQHTELGLLGHAFGHHEHHAQPVGGYGYQPHYHAPRPHYHAPRPSYYVAPPRPHYHEPHYGHRGHGGGYGYGGGGYGGGYGY